MGYGPTITLVDIYGNPFGTTTTPIITTTNQGGSNWSVNIAQVGGITTQMATADAVTPANIPEGALGLYNGSNYDRWRSSGIGDGINVGAAASAAYLYNGSSHDRWRSDGTGLGKVSLYGKNVAAGDTAIAVDSSGRFTPNQGIGATSYGNTWAVQQSLTNKPIAAGAGTTVIKAFPGTLTTILITSAGTASLQIFDNASAGSGTLLFISPPTTTVGQIFTLFGAAIVGMTALGATGTPAATVFYS